MPLLDQDHYQIPPAQQSYIAELIRPRRRRGKAKSARNYAGRSTKATQRKQALVLEWLREMPRGLIMQDIATVLGCSRQLALYHIKKMVATGLIIAELEPCHENGGVRYRVWDRACRARALAKEVYGVALAA